MTNTVVTATIDVGVGVRASFSYVLTTNKTKRPISEVTLTRFAAGVAPGVDTIGIDYVLNSLGGYIISCEVGSSYDQISATAIVEMASPLDDNGNSVTFKPMDRVVIRQGWNDLQDISMKTTFYGFIDTVSLGNPPRTQRISCRDILKLPINHYYTHDMKEVYFSDTEDNIVEDGDTFVGRSIANRQIEKVVEDFLVAAGIPTSRQTLDTSSITIGSINPVVFEWESAMDAILRLCDLGRFKVWATPDGFVKMAVINPVASGKGVANTFQSEISYVGADEQQIRTRVGNLVDIETTVVDDIRNWITVIGRDGDYEILTSTIYGDSAYIPDPPKYRKAEISSSLFDTQAMVNWIASGTYYELNRLQYSAVATVEASPDLRLGNNVSFNDGYAASGMVYFLSDYRTTHDSSGWLAKVTAIGGVGEGSPAVGNQSPVAAFSYEVVKTAGGNSLVSVNANDSYDPGGVGISSYLWVSTGYANGTLITHSYYVDSAITSISVALTVSDGTLSDSVTKTIQLTPGGGSMVDKVMFLAVGNYVHYSEDSGENWDSILLY